MVKINLVTYVWYAGFAADVVASEPANSTYTISDRIYGSGADNVTVKVLENQVTGEHANILMNWGGKIEQLTLRSSSTIVRDVIATRCGGMQNCTIDMLKGQASLGAMLVPFANRISQGIYKWSGKLEHLTNDNSTASHGFLIGGMPMAELFQHTSSRNATLMLGVTFNGSHPGYPFIVSVNITYVLSQKGLTVTMRARNELSDRPAPFMAGCHPYFKLLHSNFTTAKLKFDMCSGWNRQFQNEFQVPSGKTTRCFGFNGTDSIADPHEGCPACDNPPIWDDGFSALSPPAECPSLVLRILDGDDTMWLELGEGFRYIQVYSGNAEAGLAVEPMSSATDSWNNLDGIIVLEAGKIWLGQFHIGIDYADEISEEAIRNPLRIHTSSEHAMNIGLISGCIACGIGFVFAAVVVRACARSDRSYRSF